MKAFQKALNLVRKPTESIEFKEPVEDLEKRRGDLLICVNLLDTFTFENSILHESVFDEKTSASYASYSTSISSTIAQLRPELLHEKIQIFETEYLSYLKEAIRKKSIMLEEENKKELNAAGLRSIQFGSQYNHLFDDFNSKNDITHFAEIIKEMHKLYEKNRQEIILQYKQKKQQQMDKKIEADNAEIKAIYQEMIQVQNEINELSNSKTTLELPQLPALNLKDKSSIKDVDEAIKEYDAKVKAIKKAQPEKLEALRKQSNKIKKTYYADNIITMHETLKKALQEQVTYWKQHPMRTGGARIKHIDGSTCVVPQGIGEMICKLDPSYVLLPRVSFLWKDPPTHPKAKPLTVDIALSHLKDCIGITNKRLDITPAEKRQKNADPGQKNNLEILQAFKLLEQIKNINIDNINDSNNFQTFQSTVKITNEKFTPIIPPQATTTQAADKPTSSPS